MIGIVGFAIGIAEMVGSLLLLSLGSRVSKTGRDCIIMAVFLIHTISYLMAYLNMPHDCPSVETTAETAISIRWLAILTAAMLGFGDALMMNTIFTLVAANYKGNSAPPAFALGFFSQSIASAIAYFYAPIDIQ